MSAIHLDNQHTNLRLSAHLLVSNKQRSKGHGQITTHYGISSNDSACSLMQKWKVRTSKNIEANSKFVAQELIVFKGIV